MAGFGKKNARGVELRRVMIYAAAEVFEKEKLSRRLLGNDEVQEIVQLVCESKKVCPSRVEFSSAVVGTKRLTSHRTFIESIATRWSSGSVEIQYDDLKLAGTLLERTDSETARLRPLI